MRILHWGVLGLLGGVAAFAAFSGSESVSSASGITELSSASMPVEEEESEIANEAAPDMAHHTEAREEDAALHWKVPADWKEAPGQSTMRLFTYVVPGGAEVSVMRAGGTTDANLARWVDQFETASRSKPKRVVRTVHGLAVTSLELTGTFAGMGAGMGTDDGPRSRWALYGVIVETKGMPYFFKMTGPESAVQKARPSMEALIASFE